MLEEYIQDFKENLSVLRMVDTNSLDEVSEENEHSDEPEIVGSPLGTVTA